MYWGMPTAAGLPSRRVVVRSCRVLGLCWLLLLLPACGQEGGGTVDLGLGDGPRQCVDEDGDRFGVGPDCLGEDCDDRQATIHPGAPERCDGVDDDCDGVDPCDCPPWLGQAGCPGEQICQPIGPDATAHCAEPPLGQPTGDGQPCGPVPCRPGSLCVRWSAGTQLCTPMCDPFGGTGCTAPAACLMHHAQNPAIGFCTEPPPACNIYVPSCGVGQACRPYFTLFGPPTTRCQAAGPQAAGETCGGAVGECQAGLICVRDSQEPDLHCYAVCEADQDCPAAQPSCNGRTNELQIRYCR